MIQDAVVTILGFVVMIIVGSALVFFPRPLARSALRRDWMQNIEADNETLKKAEPSDKYIQSVRLGGFILFLLAGYYLYTFIMG